MNRIWMLLLPLSILIGCSDQAITNKQSEQAKSAAPESNKPEKSTLDLVDQEQSEANTMPASKNTSQSSSENAEADQDRIEPPVAKFKEGVYQSPFTKETVLKLNAIVQRSKTAVEEFDRLIYGRTKDKLNKEQSLSRIEELSEAAAAARNDLRTAVKELKASGEVHDQVLLSKMVRFVRQVDTHIERKIRELKSETATSPVKKD